MNVLKKHKSPENIADNISPQEIREHLAEMFKSKDFIASQRLMDFLSYVVEQTLEGNIKNIKAYNIAVDVFGLGSDFDSLINPLVRTEAVRLRSKLEHYYLLNPTSNIHISIPKGGYSPIFTRIQNKDYVSEDLHLPELPTSIVIVPFENINNSVEGKNFNSGLTNEIITSLTRFHEITVIDHNNYARIKDTAPSTQPMSPYPRFILSGGVLFQKKKFKLWVSLGDSTTSENIWAESFSGAFKDDIFETLENIAEKIVYRIAADFGFIQQTLLKEFDNGRLPSSYAQKVYLLYHRWINRLTISDFKLALSALEEVLAEEPGNVQARGMLADLYASNHYLSYGLVKNDLQKSLQMATDAANADPGCQVAHLALAFNYFLRNSKNKFLISAARVLEINPTSSSAMTSLASWYGLLGYWDEALELTKRVFQLNPASPGWCHATLAFYHYYRGDYEKALFEAQKINMPQVLWDPLFRLISSGQLKDVSGYEQAYSDLIEFFPNFEKNQDALIKHSIPNPEYVDMVQNGLKICKSLKAVS